MTSNIPWFKLALIGTFIGVSALIGYAATASFSKTYESETIEPIQGKDELMKRLCSNTCFFRTKTIGFW